MRYSTVYLFHGRGSSSVGVMHTLSLILQRKVGGVTLIRPNDMPHARLETSPLEAYAELAPYVSLIQPKSLIVGVELGGLLAAKLQQDQPDLELGVVAVSSPTHAEGLGLRHIQSPGLTALYSGLDPVMKDMDWTPYAGNLIDVPWLRDHNVNRHKYSLADILKAVIEGHDSQRAAESIFPRG
jgi:hypothetical protein